MKSIIVIRDALTINVPTADERNAHCRLGMYWESMYMNFVDYERKRTIDANIINMINRIKSIVAKITINTHPTMNRRPRTVKKYERTVKITDEKP